MKRKRNADQKTEELLLGAREHALFGKLLVSQSDIGTAQLCARFLLKKRWHAPPYFRRGSIYIQQVSLTTTMIVAYCRPFVVGKGNINFPKRLLQFTKDQQDLHDRLIVLRNEEHAHTDASTYIVRPFKGAISSMQTLRATYFEPQDIDLFLEMTSGLNDRIEMRMEEIRLGAA
ncbi:hypothetical protein [Mesorhizobium sp. M0199]|uniref:hypothetical protein n=1 Tax=unclassified Mesorhizobium TaxID=325217 RepID=UPI00333C4C8D